MVSFRKWILALTVLVLFAGLASAQVNTNPLQCATNVSVTPTLRAEGFTEQTGDVTLTCTGGAPLVVGGAIPLVNFAIFLNTAVTSRLLGTQASGISEALLLIDEPGSGLVSPAGPGFGPAAPQTVCPTPTTGCVEFVNQVPNVVTPGGPPVQVAVNTPGATTQGFNVFQGIVTGNAVTFFGIPVLPPATTGSRVFRITNIRANATALSGGSAAGATPVIASISISGATSLLISNPTPTVGFVQSGLTTAASSATGLNQCQTQTRTAVSLLTYTENFGTAFKTRVAAMTNTQYAGQISNPAQNVPGTVYQSESNFVLTTPSNTNTPAGLADYGTRLKATFNNVPAGVRLFVSLSNVNNLAAGIAAPSPVGGTSTSTYAQLVTSETVSDGNAGVSGFFPAVPDTGVVGGGSNVPVAEIPVVNGSASAVWEVVNTNPNAIEAAKFAVYTTYVSNVAQNSPPAGTATVNMSFAPTPPAFTAAAGAAASASLTVPRFIADTGAAKNLFTVNICRTILLYPYVTNVAGFDTGLAIANTSTDPFGTGAQAGSCQLNWFQGTNNPAQGNTGNIASGTVYTALASTTVPGFSGYMIAVCNFQYAHGFAFISDLGARNLAMGYLALVITDPTTQLNGVRNASPVGAPSVAVNGGGESNGQ